MKPTYIFDKNAQ